MFSLLCKFVALVVFHFGFEGKTLDLFASFSGHCLPFYFFIKNHIQMAREFYDVNMDFVV